uniref:Uncharacterized protein n=1 Tax=Virus NIOZ-UU159 TaxID=2763270 RepID=A0A7S9STD9_9VIRU|nr:MAG: hypothetical protein NIOZUU159_00334 [Virus NIOZ-UU159]|tara:strand:- start:1630 stop:1848 length:219 start_codon:yes stop_codon:yes gene_type:complete
MTSPQTIKNTIKITHDLSCIIMRNRAIMMIKMLKDKKNKYNKNKQTKVMNNKFCIGFCENPLNCSCFINNSI